MFKFITIKCRACEFVTMIVTIFKGFIQGYLNKMIRRPPTSIELKLDDLGEYEAYRREQEAAKDQPKTVKPVQEPPPWNPGPKPKQEIYERIGYIPPTSTNSGPPMYQLFSN